MRGIHASDEREPKTVYYDIELDDAGLNPYQFRVYNRIARRSGGGDHNCTESLAKMAADCLMSRPTLIRAIAVLIKRRMIRRVSRSGDTSYYALLDKSKWIPGQPQSHPNLDNHRATPGKRESHPWTTTEPPLVNERATMKKTNKQTRKETAVETPAPFNGHPVTVNHTAADSLSSLLCSLHGISDKSGWQLQGKYQSLAIQLDGIGATIEHVKAFWDHRTVKPQIQYFLPDFVSWRASQVKSSPPQSRKAIEIPDWYKERYNAQ